MSDVPGTTRDYLTATAIIDGFEVELIDTAGWEAADNLIMQRAEQLREEQINSSDLLIWCSAADLDSKNDLRFDSQQMLEAGQAGHDILHVTTRADLRSTEAGMADVVVSSLAGNGIDRLIAEYFESRENGQPKPLRTTVLRLRLGVEIV